MLHLYAPVESTRSLLTRYTAQGLGDRVHLLTIAWSLSCHADEPVKLHLSGDKLTREKRSSFKEIFGLFPNPNFEIIYHEVFPESDQQFQNYLKDNGVIAESFYYGDHPGWREKKSGIEISRFLKAIPLIFPPIIESDSKVITSQWDTTGERRKFAPTEIVSILDCYREQGFDVVTVGGEAEDSLFRNSLSAVGQLMTRSAFHIGVDSGFMHLAQLFLPPNRIHVYTKPENFWSHHLLRGIENGMVLNRNFAAISKFDFWKISLRYDSPVLIRFWHSAKSFMPGKSNV